MIVVTLILGLITVLLSITLSVSIFISGVASVMKFYGIIEDTWFMIWDLPLYIFMLWIALNIFSRIKLQ